MPADSNGVPWNGSFITASGNLLADFQLNVTAEAQGRLQVARLFNMTDDPGVKQMLRFLLARDTMHQNMWLAAIEQLKEDGLEDMPVPEAFPDSGEFTEEYGYTYLGFSSGTDSVRGTLGVRAIAGWQGRVPVRRRPAGERPGAGAAAGGPAAVRHQSGCGRLGREHGQEQAHLTCPVGSPAGFGRPDGPGRKSGLGHRAEQGERFVT